MMPEELTTLLKQRAVALGFDLVGAAPAVAPPRIGDFRRWLAAGFAGEMHYLPDRAAAYEHPGHVLEGVRSLLMLAMNYRTEEPAPCGAGQGTVARYAWGTDYHDLIRDKLHALADYHRTLTPAAAVRGTVDTAPLSEREFAAMAGMGWIGKNTLLLNRQFGSWIVLAALLTSEPLAYDEPLAKGHCGTCRACLDACPTGALVEPYWLDARKCISYLTIESRSPTPPEYHDKLGGRIFGCDACQDVCPWNRRTPMTDEPAFHPRPGMNPVELDAVQAMDDAEFRRRFRGTPLLRARREGLQERAAIVRISEPSSSTWKPPLSPPPPSGE